MTDADAFLRGAAKCALIVGVTGQDGSYLAEFLLARGYAVHGTLRRSSSFNTSRIDHVLSQLRLHFADLTDAGSLTTLLAKVRPDEVYNLAAQSHVGTSFELPVYSADVAALGTLRLLEAVRAVCPEARVYQASSSEMFGDSPPPQREDTPFRPRSPYACGKAAAHWLAANYREAYGLHVSCGILFNHESERRGPTFVTRKVTMAAARIKLGLQPDLRLGNLEAARDWGHAEDYVRAMWLMLQRPEPGDYVIATGESHTVREFIHHAFTRLGLDWERYVTTDPAYFRPTEVDCLRGDASKARRLLGWEPTIRFQALVQRMVAHDLELAQREAA